MGDMDLLCLHHTRCMTTTIPKQPLTGSALQAALGELIDTDLDVAAARCGYVDEQGWPDIDEFKKALLIQLPN